MSDDNENILINKYRPGEFGQMFGHKEVLEQLRLTLKSNAHAHSFLLYGPSGVGKTTLARIIAKEFDADVIEFSAAEYSRVDDMRRLCDTARHRSLRGSGTRLFLMNEVQRLSRGAWDTLLTILEEPPPHLYFAMTTTEFDKVPEAVLTRCYTVKLNPISSSDIEELLAVVIDTEGWTVSNDVFNKVVNSAHGSPRLALNTLQNVWAVKQIEEVERIIALPDGSTALLDICKFLAEGKTGWIAIKRMLSRLGDDDFETGINAIGRYLGRAMLDEEATEAQCKRSWMLLETLIVPTSTYDRRIAFYATLGRIVWGMEEGEK